MGERVDMWATLFQGQNLFIMIGLGVFVFAVIFLMAKRMARNAKPEDAIFQRRLAKHMLIQMTLRFVGAALLIGLLWLLVMLRRA